MSDYVLSSFKSGAGVVPLLSKSTGNFVIITIGTKDYTLNRGLELLNEKIENNNESSEQIAYTLLASKWGTNGIYTDLESIYPSASYNLIIEPAYNCTSAQHEEYVNASIVGANTTFNYIKALGTIPTIDIPIVVTLTGKG